MDEKDIKKEELSELEKKVISDKEAGQAAPESEKSAEQKDHLSSDALVSAELRKELDMMSLDESQKDEAEKKSQKIAFLGEKEKLEHLLQMAKEKGVAFAVNVAKSMNEPYLLDLFHDMLAKEGLYKTMLKDKNR